jgi:DNA-binding beta-propeller fold protein YncE
VGKPGNSLTVIDLDRVAIDRTIGFGPYQRPDGIAFYPGDTLLTVTSEASGAVLPVDLRTNQVTATGVGWRLGRTTVSIRASNPVSRYRIGTTQHNLYLASELTIPF